MKTPSIRIDLDNEQMLKDIEAGKYRDYYVLYRRKSTDDAENQQNSLSYQKTELIRFCLKENLRIAPVSLKGFCVDGMITEKHSAFKTNKEIVVTRGGQVQYAIERPKFQRLLYFLSKGLFKGVAVLSSDRASRNNRDDVVIRDLMDKGVDFKFVTTKYDKSSAGELHKDVDAMMNRHRSRDAREKVTFTFRNLRERGVVTHRAPVGYLNNGSMYDKPFDPDRAPTIKRMFELCGTGEWTLAALARWANAEGLTMPPMRRRRTDEEKAAEEDDEDQIRIEPTCRPLDENDVDRIILNRFYEGLTKGNDGEWVQSISHKPLVDSVVADKARRALGGKRTSKHYSKKLPLAYRGLFYCTLCGRVYTPYVQKGHVYMGARCLKHCQNPKRNVAASVLEEKVGELITRLTFSNGELADIDTRAQTDISDIEKKRQQALEHNDRRKRKVREELSYLRENRITLLKAGVYSPEEYVEKERSLNSELAELQQQEQAADASAHEVIVEIIKLSELLKDAYLHYRFANPVEKEQIIGTIFSELKYSGDSLEYQCKNGFRSLQNRFFQFCDPGGNRTLVLGLKSPCPNR